MAWLVDTGVFGLLARVTRGEGRWRPEILHVGEAVAAECRQGDPNLPQTTLIDAEAQAGRVVTVLSVPYGGDAFTFLWDHLRPTARTATADFGEHEAITICAYLRPDLVFVTLDQTALALAVSELGPGRATTPYELWAALRDLGIVDTEVFERLLDRTSKHSQKIPVPWRFRSR